MNPCMLFLPPDTAVCERLRMTREPYLIGYARVSKGDDQSNAAQRHALDAAGCRRVFEETASGGRWDRPRLLEMIGQLREGDVVVVWKLDRLSRSLKDMLHIMERIELAGAGFRSLTEAIDTTTAAGRMMMQMIGSFAEFERAMIRNFVLAGVALGAEDRARFASISVELSHCRRHLAAPCWMRPTPGSNISRTRRRSPASRTQTRRCLPMPRRRGACPDG